jgi:hypothetical protein
MRLWQFYGNYILYSLTGVVLLMSAHAYGFAPTQTWMTPMSEGAGFVYCTLEAWSPSYRNAQINISPDFFRLRSFRGNPTQIPSIVLSPARNVPFPRLNLGPGSVGACSCQPDSFNNDSICSKRRMGSMSTCIAISKEFGNLFTKLDIKRRCSSVNCRGARRVSRAIIFSFCSEAMCPSDANNIMLNTVSNTTPSTTIQRAVRCTASQYLCDSKIIPIPSNTAAAISASSINGLADDKNSTDRIWGAITGMALLLTGVSVVLIVIRNKMRGQREEEKKSKSY